MAGQEQKEVEDNYPIVIVMSDQNQLATIMTLQSKISEKLREYKSPFINKSGVQWKRVDGAWIYKALSVEQFPIIHQHACLQQSLRNSLNMRAFGVIENVWPLIKFLSILSIIAETPEPVRGEEDRKSSKTIIRTSNGLISIECEHWELTRAIRMCHKLLTPLQNDIREIILGFDFSHIWGVVQDLNNIQHEARKWAHQTLQDFVAFLKDTPNDRVNERIIPEKLFNDEHLTVRQLGVYLAANMKKYTETINWRPYGEVDEPKWSNFPPKVTYLGGKSDSCKGIIHYLPQQVSVRYFTHALAKLDENLRDKFANTNDKHITDPNLEQKEHQTNIVFPEGIDTAAGLSQVCLPNLPDAVEDEIEMEQVQSENPDHQEWDDQGEQRDMRKTLHEEDKDKLMDMRFKRDRQLTQIKWLTSNIFSTTIFHMLSTYMDGVDDNNLPTHSFRESDYTDVSKEAPGTFDTTIVRFKNVEVAMMSFPIQKNSLMETILKHGLMYKWIHTMNQLIGKQSFPQFFCTWIPFLQSCQTRHKQLRIKVTKKGRPRIEK